MTEASFQSLHSRLGIMQQLRIRLLLYTAVIMLAKDLSPGSIMTEFCGSDWCIFHVINCCSRMLMHQLLE